MITKQQIEQATDQELADLVAVHCMGWTLIDERPSQHFYQYVAPSRVRDPEFFNDVFRVEYAYWQPHLNTDKGKVQAIDLADKLGLSVSFAPDDGLNFINGFDSSGNWIEVADNSWQIAVLRAALLSKIGD